MPELPDIPRPSQLWKRLPAEVKLGAAEAFWADPDAATEQAEAVMLIAQRIKFRAKSVISMPRDRKAKHLIGIGAVSELLAARLLVAYHLAHQRPMMATFLDALGIAHDEGLIADEELQPPTAERLQAAAQAIADAHPAEDVALYLSTLMWLDPDSWGGLADTPQLSLPA
jgi:hypothetical protein